MENLIAILSSGAGALIITQILKPALKGVSDKYGRLATQFTLLIVSFLVALVFVGLNWLPEGYSVAIGSIFISAMAIYEIVWKNISKIIK